MKDTVYATVTWWDEYHTPSGRWSRVRHNEKQEVYKPHNLAYFFRAKFPGERREYGYFQQGYLPRRVTSPAPDRKMRWVYTFDYYTGPREITKYEYESENNNAA